MFRNGVECMSGILMYQDIVQAPELQNDKEYSKGVAHLPKSPPIAVHTAEVLRQVKGAGVEKGGWVGGDAWFGSIMTLVEVMEEFGVYSTWVIKGNTNLYPMKALHAVLTARHGDHAAGHWVTMKANIGGQDMFCLAYAWSNRGVSYFLSNCGVTSRHSVPYKTHFTDEHGNVTNKSLPHPCIAHFIYNFLPLIDEHNKQRQSILRLEKKWPTKNCWFRIVTTIVGMAVVDLHQF